MRENVRAPQAGRNNVLRSRYAEHPVRCLALGKSSPSLAQKRASLAAPAARKTSSVPMSLRESNRCGWALLIRETRRVTGAEKKHCGEEHAGNYCTIVRRSIRQILSPRKRGSDVFGKTRTPPSLRPAQNAGRSFRWGYNLTALRA